MCSQCKSNSVDEKLTQTTNYPDAICPGNLRDCDLHFLRSKPGKNYGLAVVIVVTVMIMFAAVMGLLDMLPVIPVSVPVPAVVMLNPPAISFPEALEELIALITRPHPAGSGIGRASPITFMPSVMLADWIPITLYPHKFGAWAWRPGVDHTRRRGRADSNSDRDIGGVYGSGYE